jgi:acylglycerol lipase
MAGTTEQRRGRHGTERLARRWSPAGAPRAAMALVHGINEHSGRYERVGDGLASRDIDVLAFDLPGHGRSGGRRGHVDHFDELLDEVEDLIADRRALGVPVVLFGHSLGGLIAVAYAESDRPQPDLLALSAPALASSTPVHLRWAAGVLGRVAPRVAVPNSLDAERLTRDEAVARAYVDDPLRLRKVTARLGLEVFTAQLRATAQVDRIRVPTWVVHGADDRVVPAEASAPLERLAEVSRTVQPGLRHECLNEPEGPVIVDELADWILGRVRTG